MIVEVGAVGWSSALRIGCGFETYLIDFFKFIWLAFKYGFGYMVITKCLYQGSNVILTTGPQWITSTELIWCIGVFSK